MKTFEKWLDKSKYEFTIHSNNGYKAYHINGCNGFCIVHFIDGSRGGYVFDHNYETKCKSIKEIIELVNFLSGGEC